MNIKIEAKEREISKKSALKDFRKNGLIPAIIYKAGEKGTNILIPTADFKKSYKSAIGEVAFYEITVDGKEVTTILKEKQIDPVSREYVHLDFIEILKGQKLTLDIPINFVGTPAGVEEGGLIDIILRSIKVSCLPKDVPGNIKIDISKMEIGDSIYFGDLNLENMDTDISDDSSIINLVASMSEEEYEASLETDIEAGDEDVETLEEEMKEESEVDKPKEEVKESDSDKK